MVILHVGIWLKKDSLLWVTLYTKHYYMQKKTTHDEYHLLHFYVQEVGTKKDMEIE